MLPRIAVWTWATRGPGPELQWLVTPAGDANGDGLLDVLVTTRSIAADGVAEPIYLVYGSRKLPAEADLDAFIEAGGGAKIELEETAGGTVYARAAGR